MIEVTKCAYGYEAKIGPWSRDGETAAKAKERVLEAVSRHTYDRCYVLCGDGTLLVLFYSDGWEYEIVRADRDMAVVCRMGDVEKLDALRVVLDHARQSYGGVTRIISSGFHLERLLLAKDNSAHNSAHS
ncbi:MAG: hypothetical protein QXZ09_09205 [Candidatus Methanomethylicaceae archaeon]